MHGIIFSFYAAHKIKFIRASFFRHSTFLFHRRVNTSPNLSPCYPSALYTLRFPLHHEGLCYTQDINPATFWITTRSYDSPGIPFKYFPYPRASYDITKNFEPRSNPHVCLNASLLSVWRGPKDRGEKTSFNIYRVSHRGCDYFTRNVQWTKSCDVHLTLSGVNCARLIREEIRCQSREVNERFGNTIVLNVNMEHSSC